MRDSKPVLLVEDDIASAMMVRRAFGDLKITSLVVHSRDGEEALEYLRDDNNRKPYIILLDLNMPKMNGIEFLKIIKGDPVLRSIPVVMLTTSNDERDIAESFYLNVAGYIVKPSDHEQFVETIRIIDLYWSYSELPNREGNYDRHKIFSIAR